MDVTKLVLAITTVDREPPYVHQTLASLFASDPLVHELPAVHLVVGTKNAEYLRHFRHHPNLRFYVLDDEEHERISKWTPHRRCCHNYVRCLSLPIPAGGGVCVVEDDVIFRHGFLNDLLKAISEMENVGHLRPYALSLFCDRDLEARPSFRQGVYYCRYGLDFYGTQGMYYPRDTALELRDYVQQHGVDTHEYAVDLLIGGACKGRMYGCPRSLVDHIGAVSTGLGGMAPSPSFRRPSLIADAVTEGGNSTTGMTAGPPQAIPKVLHRICVGSERLPSEAEEWARSWSHHHPGWEIEAWTDRDLPPMGRSRSAYERMRTPAEKADCLRHDILTTHGGVCIDADMECLKCIEPLLKGVLCFYGDRVPGLPGTAILGSVPRHPLLDFAFRRNRARWLRQRGRVLGDTGQEALARPAAAYVDGGSAINLRDPHSGRASGRLLLCHRQPICVFDPWVFYPLHAGEQWQPEAHPDAYAVCHWQVKR